MLNRYGFQAFCDLFKAGWKTDIRAPSTTMQMDGHVRIRVTRALFMNNERVEPGTIVSINPVDAADAVASKRAEFVSPEDREVAVDASRRAANRLCPSVRERGDSFATKYLRR